MAIEVGGGGGGRRRQRAGLREEEEEAEALLPWTGGSFLLLPSRAQPSAPGEVNGGICLSNGWGFWLCSGREEEAGEGREEEDGGKVEGGRSRRRRTSC